MDKASLHLNNKQLCIGCGVCAAACPHDALTMLWSDNCEWRPKIDETTCVHCGVCVKTCPFSSVNLDNWTSEFNQNAQKTGLVDFCDCGIGQTLNRKNLFQSPSGGLTTEILKRMLAEKVVDGIIAPVKICAKAGEPHNEVRILTSPADAEHSRGVFYEPVCFNQALKKAVKENGRYAITATPCVLKALSFSPEILRSKITIQIGLMCSHSVTGQFMDCLAIMTGIAKGKAYSGNLRSKDVLMEDASDFCNTFREAEGPVFHSDRYASGYTRMWRAFCFARECCLYCPDFFVVNADISVKDVWGRLKNSPFGQTMAIVRNKQMATIIRELMNSGIVSWQPVSTDDVLHDQLATVIFKQVNAVKRWNNRKSMWKMALWPVGKNFDHLKKLVALRLSSTFYRQAGIHVFSRIKKMKLPRKIGNSRATSTGRPRILIAGGYGYKNAGDEAQLSACIKHWQAFAPWVEITVLSPNPEHTIRTHNISSTAASRNLLFGASDSSHYAESDTIFRLWFIWIALRECLRALTNKYFVRCENLYNTLTGGTYSKLRNTLTLGVKADLDRFHEMIRNADVLHFCGGGYMTGMTASRLWDSMLLARIAQYYGVRVVLSGQTIGRFNNATNRWIAKWGLKKCDRIFLRDAGQSIKDLRNIGISGDRIQTTFDDALFCESADNKVLAKSLANSGLDAGAKYIAVSFHHWGQNCNMRGLITERFADICAQLSNRLSLPILMVPMVPSDKKDMEALLNILETPAFRLDYDYDFRVAKAAFGNAECCLTFKHHPIVFAMAAAVPTLAVALDPYYEHKNRGALDLFGQGLFVIDKKIFWKEQNTLDLITDFADTRKQIREQINSTLNKLKEKDGKTIWLTALDLMSYQKLRNSSFNINLIFDKAIQHFLTDKWILWKSELGINKVALFGAGIHTRWLLNRKWINTGPAVTRILDTVPQSDTLLGRPVINALANNACAGVDAVVISSDENESLLYANALKLFHGIPVLNFYELRYGALFARYNSKFICTTDNDPS